MPFEHDVSLVTRALELLRGGKIPVRRRDRVNDLINDLREESRLANGPLKDRSEHWRQRALVTQRTLRQELEEC